MSIKVLHACYQEAFRIVWQKHYLRGRGSFMAILPLHLLFSLKNYCSKHKHRAACLFPHVSLHSRSQAVVFPYSPLLGKYSVKKWLETNESFCSLLIKPHRIRVTPGMLGGKGSNQFKAVKKVNENMRRSFSPFFTSFWTFRLWVLNILPKGSNKLSDWKRESMLLTTWYWRWIVHRCQASWVFEKMMLGKEDLSREEGSSVTPYLFLEKPM